MNNGLAYLLVFLLALGVSLALTPFAIWLATRLNAVAKFGGRRLSDSDARRVPKLGGIAIFGGFVVAVVAAQMLPVARLDAYEVIRLAGLLIGGTAIFAAGLLDDLVELTAMQQFAAQFAAAAIAILFQIFIEFFNNPLTGQQTNAWPFVVTVTISFFWLVGMVNTVNWLDGADGLAAGVACIAGLMLFANSAFRVDPPQTSVSLLHLALIGSSLGFLIFNFYPSRITMGGGASFLGFVLGALSIIGGAKMATILLVMGLPLLDSVWQVINRLRQGKNPFVGDRGHLHFRLQDMGISQRQIVLGYYIFCGLFGLLTLITASQVFKFIALGVMVAIALVGFFFVQRNSQARSLAVSSEPASPLLPSSPSSSSGSSSSPSSGSSS